MSDFPDDPSVVARRKELLNQKSTGIASPVEGSLRSESSRANLQNEITWQSSDSDRVRNYFYQVFKPLDNSSLNEFTNELSSYLNSQDLDLPDGSLVVFLRNELREAIGQALSRAARRKEIAKEALENLHEVLSSADLEMLLKEFGSNFITALNKDILNGLSISEQIEMLEPLFLIGALSEETVKSTQENFFQDLQSLDPATALFRQTEITLKKIDKEFTLLLEELIEGKPRKGVKGFSKVNELTKLAKHEAKVRVRRKRGFYGALIFFLFFALFNFAGTSYNLNFVLSAGLTCIIGLVSKK